MVKVLALFVIIAVMACLSAAQECYVSASSGSSVVTGTSSCYVGPLEDKKYLYAGGFHCPPNYLFIEPSFSFRPYYETFEGYDDFQYVITSISYSDPSYAFSTTGLEVAQCTSSITGVKDVSCSLQGYGEALSLYLYLQCTNLEDDCKQASIDSFDVTCSGYSGSGSTDAPVSTNSPGPTTSTNSRGYTTTTNSPGSTTTTNSPGSATTAPGESTTAPATKHSVASFVTPSLAGLALGIVAFFFTAYF